MSKHDKSEDVAGEVRETCLCLHAQRAARALARRFDAALRPAGLTNGQYSLLVALSRPAPWSIGELADLLAMDRTTMTAKLKPLERRGLLRVAVDEVDRRNRKVAITEDGRAVLRRALPLWRQAHDELERAGGFDADRLRADLRTLA